MEKKPTPKLLNSTELGIKIAELKMEIISLPLEETMQQVNYWETITPLVDPTLYIQYRATMETFAKTVRILLRTKHELQKTIIEDSNN